MIKKNNSVIFLMISVAMAALAGCADMQRTETKIDTALESVNAMKTLTERNAVTGAGVRSKGMRYAGEDVVIRRALLPALFDQTDSYTTKGSQSINQVLEDIAATRKLIIKTSEIAQAQAGSAAISQQASPLSSSQSLAGNVTIEYTGTTKGLLDAVASKGNVSWRYNQATKTVEFYRYETKTLYVSLPGGSKTVSSSISLSGASGGSGGGGGGGGGAGNVSVAQNMSIDPWGSIVDGIGTILSEGSDQNKPSQKGGTGSLSASGVNGSAIANVELGIITVTARPTTMERVQRYITSINDRFAQNVLIDVKIFSVSLDQQRSLGFNVNMLYSSLGGLGASLSGPPAIQAGTGTPGILTLSSKDPNSPFSGSSLVAQALSQYGKVSLQKQGQVMAINGQPSPIQVANEISYVSGSSTTTSANVGATTTQTQSSKVVGFTANFLPLILGDNRILLQYQMQISALAAPLTPNAQGVVSPNITSQSLQQQAFVRDGQAIVLFGFDEQRDAVNSSLNFGGTSKASTSERQMIVIVMQVNTGAKNEIN